MGWLVLYLQHPPVWMENLPIRIYHTTGLVVSSYFRSLGFPCLLYIDDRHNGQLQVDFSKGAYAEL